ncbi:unnamed protein product [Cyclocybe aegerita]|uniref:Uncharacterized protein n=1 Tax=Cyclocybe aegerita TaxID=1973307 RepID=A0A8S0WAB7_CYCAE|nr:unnamed protein product [Cyclocybe aegerita]
MTSPSGVAIRGFKKLVNPPGGFAAMPPSHEVAPTKVDTLPQQGSTQPGDGATVHAGGEIYPTEMSASTQPSQTTGKVPFKEQVVGYAQKTRGTLLGKPELKDHGERILAGQTTHAQDREKN